MTPKARTPERWTALLSSAHRWCDRFWRWRLLRLAISAARHLSLTAHYQTARHLETAMRHEPPLNTPDESLGLLGRIGRTATGTGGSPCSPGSSGWHVLIVLWTGFGAPAKNSFTGSDPGQTVLDQHFPRQSGDTLTLAIRSSEGIDSPAVRARVTARSPRSPRAACYSVAGPYRCPARSRPTGTSRSRPSSSTAVSRVSRRRGHWADNDATAASGHGVTFSLGGDIVDPAETPVRRLRRTGSASCAAAIVLLIAFGSLLAMGLPLVTAAARDRRRAIADRAARPRLPRAVLLPDHRLDDRPGRRRRLRAVHRHPVP